MFYKVKNNFNMTLLRLNKYSITIQPFLYILILTIKTYPPGNSAVITYIIYVKKLLDFRFIV